MAATISQLFSSPSNCNLHLSTVVRPRGGHLFRPKLSIRTSLEGNGAETSTSETQINLRHTAEVSKSDIVGAAKSHTTKDCLPENTGIIEPVKEHSVIQKKKAAKIHDFCFGIPYGGLVLGGGLIGFIFSGNPTTLFFGGGLLALSTLSLKIWRQGKSSLPFILGQTGHGVEVVVEIAKTEKGGRGSGGVNHNVHIISVWTYTGQVLLVGRFSENLKNVHSQPFDPEQQIKASTDT